MKKMLDLFSNIELTTVLEIVNVIFAFFRGLLGIDA